MQAKKPRSYSYNCSTKHWVLTSSKDSYVNLKVLERRMTREEKAELLVQKCIEVRGLKVQVSDVPVPVPYGSAFEGEVVRKTDMRVEFGGKKSRAFEYLFSAASEYVVDGS